MARPGAYHRGSSQCIIDQGFLSEWLAIPEPHQVYEFRYGLQKISDFIDREPFRVYLGTETLHLVLNVLRHLLHALNNFIYPLL